MLKEVESPLYSRREKYHCIEEVPLNTPPVVCIVFIGCVPSVGIRAIYIEGGAPIEDQPLRTSLW